MASNWTCGRCSARNPEDAVSCRSCGLIRGGIVTNPNQGAPTTGPASASWPSSPPSIEAEGAPPPAPEMWAGAPAPGGYPGAPTSAGASGTGTRAAAGCLANVGIRLAVLVVIIAIGGVVAFFTNAGRDETGSINKAGELKVTELRVGDCYDLQGEGASADPNASFEKATGVPCAQPHHYEVFFTGKLGDSPTPPTETVLQAWSEANCWPAFDAYVGKPIDQSTLDYYVFYPDDSAWRQGQRDGQCSLADPAMNAITGSLKGSQR